MITIKRIRIENFQSHKDTELSFSDGLNVIVGPSDQGKSAIIRAIKWVLYNEPRGTDFIRQGTNSARVTLELSNGYVITRERAPNKNRYTLKDPDGNVSVFEGFGNEVPLEIVKAHGIPKVALDMDVRASLNIGEQLEGPFLLSESGATRAKAIGRLTGLHIIDQAIKDCATDIRRENQTCDRIEREIEDIDKKLEEYKNIEELGRRLEESEKVIARMEALTAKVDMLEEKKNSLKDIETEYLAQTKILSRLDRLEECGVYLKSAEACFFKLNQILGIKKRYSEVLTGMEEMEKVLQKTSFVDEAVEILKKASDIFSKYEKLDRLRSEFSNVGREVNQTKNILDRTSNVKELDFMIKNISDKVLLGSEITQLREKLVCLEREISRVKKNISSYENINLVQEIVTSVDKKLEVLNKLEAAKKEYSAVCTSLNDGLEFMDKNKKEIQENLNIYIDILRKSGVCPLCKSSIGDEKLENIIRHYEEVH
ncbi:Rad50 zinc hook protein [Acetivibrio thermocellus AD2]|jgi:exonuclease SbcC|uniref:Nuclease SbcCD subunit C n=1 Tax=Acetivibrio thermocellus AD2 TaxID=1138384 RepID=A0AB36TFH2_ACETH|nr:AAA family ATPase [Acetivibrio thermocellus]ADU74336.1 Rad50 zinc hook domain protein [Acetivibrio thermocellus DSM 1313]ALX08280.1 Rad50 zinc hook domain protein [Acetivibrio thermocellus AD2]ANV76028.1 Rad50 zinc hook domain protein [Acetivibrio thermocellus DSM 2360]EIC05837.1 SMC domain protein [Acetivibrio thermocellus YS]PFH02553.1 Rad50 zinc hook protein [Acetivibrio thermocellus AD2]